MSQFIPIEEMSLDGYQIVNCITVITSKFR